MRYDIRKGETWDCASKSIQKAAIAAGGQLVAAIQNVEHIPEGDFHDWFVQLPEYQRFEDLCHRLWGCGPSGVEEKS